MRPSTHRFIAVVIACSALGACGSSKPSVGISTSTIAQSSSNTAGAAGTQPAAATGKVDCAALQTALADMLVNWQLVIGFANSPTSEWANVPLGSVPKFGDQLATIRAALGSDAAAADAISFMSGANDIVARGLGGDTTAQADLGKYMGTDVSASVGKQLPISLAYSKAGCK